MRFYFKRVVKLGLETWLAFAIDRDGRIAWSVSSMSEAGARAACLKQQAKGV